MVLTYLKNWIALIPINFVLGLKVVVDSKAIMPLIGTQMDYHETDLSSEFVFNNPNVKEQCGCGQSFSV